MTDQQTAAPTLALNAALLRAVAPAESGARAKHQSTIIEACGAALEAVLTKFEITTPLRVAHFLAQVCHESDGFCTTEEYASGAAYEGRKDLGNTQVGDGRKFKGRGLIQLTGRANYEQTGKRLFEALVEAPDVAARPDQAVVIACDYWNTHKLNELADQDNVIAITRKVNGGLNGIESRRDYLGKAKAAIAQLLAGQMPIGPKPTLHRGLSGDMVTELQEKLRAKGAHLAVDGDYGPGTETAVKAWQAAHGLTPDGIAGAKTWESLT